MDATNRSTIARQIYLKVLGMMLVIILFVGFWCWHFLTDTLPYFFRTVLSTIGLDEYQAGLLEDLNEARGRAATEDMENPIIASDEIDQQYYLAWENYHQAVDACRQADLAPWRIKLAGGKLAQ